MTNGASCSAAEIQRKSLNKVYDVIAPLDHAQKMRLYRMVREGHLESMSEPVAQLLVQMLNGRRAEHARRLWTGWFDPIIVRNNALLKTDIRLAGCLHINDVSAWWFAIASRMEAQVQRIQDSIAERGKDRPLNDVFASAEARGWAEELRLLTLSILTELRATPAASTRILAEVNEHRAHMSKQQTGRRRGPVTRADIDLLMTILDAAPAWGGPDAHGLERADPVRAALQMTESGSCRRDGAAVFSVAAMHRKDAPALAERIYQAFPLPIVREAIIGRLLLAAEVLAHTLQTGFLGKQGFELFPTDGHGAEARLTHFLSWYDAVHALDLDQSEPGRSIVHQALRELTNLIHEELVSALSRRFATLTQHSGVEPLIQRVRFVNEFRAQLARRGIISSGKPWRTEDGAVVADVFRQVASAGSPDGLAMLGQLYELADHLGFPMEITALDMTLIGVVEAALRAQKALGPAEMRLVDHVVTVSRAERKRCKWWVSSEVVDLLEAAEQAGIATKFKK